MTKQPIFLWYKHSEEIYTALLEELIARCDDVKNRKLLPIRGGVKPEVLEQARTNMVGILNNARMNVVYSDIEYKTGRFGKIDLSAGEMLFGTGWYVQKWLGLSELTTVPVSVPSKVVHPVSLNPLDGTDALRQFDQGVLETFMSQRRSVAGSFKEFPNAIGAITAAYREAIDEEQASRLNALAYWRERIAATRNELSHVSSKLHGAFTAKPSMAALAFYCHELVSHLDQFLDKYQVERNLHAEAASLLKNVAMEGYRITQCRHIAGFVFEKKIEQFFNNPQLYRKRIVEGMFLRHIVSMENLAGISDMSVHDLSAEFRFATETAVVKWLGDNYGYGKNGGKPIEAVVPLTPKAPAIFDNSQKELPLEA